MLTEEKIGWSKTKVVHALETKKDYKIWRSRISHKTFILLGGETKIPKGQVHKAFAQGQTAKVKPPSRMRFSTWAAHENFRKVFLNKQPERICHERFQVRLVLNGAERISPI